MSGGDDSAGGGPPKPDDPSPIDGLLPTVTPLSGPRDPPAPASVPDGLVGRSLGHFRIESKLGQGGMGVVYRAIDERLRRPVALKVLPADVAANEDRRKRFLREARSAAAVTHPNIAAVYDVGEFDGQVFIAMELIEGDTLRARLEAGLDRPEAFRVAREIAQGLARAHEKGVVHRDLKPENVMITADSGVKILDFGLAKLQEPEAGPAEAGGASATASHLTEEGRVLGTPSYMSPEQAQGKTAAIDARTDVFAFGVMLFEMLAGTRPFMGSSSLEVLYAIVHQPAPRLETVWPAATAELSSIVARCLDKAAANRFANANALAAALATLEPPSGSGSFVRPALGPTALAHGHRATWSAGSKQATPQPGLGSAWRRWRWAGATLVTLALVGAGASLSQRRSSGGTAGNRGVAMTERPLPSSSNPEAVSHYALALQRLRLGQMTSGHEFSRALVLDPTLAAAHLRLALYCPFYGFSPEACREHYQSAASLQIALDSRDRALLPIAEAVSRDPPGYETAIKLVRQAVDSDPRDAEVLLLLEIYLLRTQQQVEGAAVAERVLALDPRSTQALIIQTVWVSQKVLQLPEAMAIADRCLKLEPDATGCLGLRIELEWSLGQCEAGLADAREFLRRQSSMEMSFSLLANALIATGGSRESIEGAIRQATSHGGKLEAGFPQEPYELQWAEWSGDFERAEEIVEAPDFAGSASSSEQDQVRRFRHRIALAEETGDAPRALQLADEFERASSAWNQNAPLGTRMERLYLRHQSGLITDSAFREGRNRLLDEDVQRHPVSKSDSRDDRSRRVAIRYARIPEEAQDALPLDRWLELSYRADAWEGLGRARILMLTGHLDESRALLEEMNRSCPVAVGGGMLFEDTPSIDTNHAVLLLGRLRETKGDQAGACAAYGTVRTRWKDAKPRSVSVEEATSRARALGCSELPPG